MSASKMTQKEREMSQAITKNVRSLMSERNITKHKDVYDNIPAFTQSQFSNVINGNTFPTMMQLIGLADFFGVSIDSLLDRNIPNKEKDLSLADCCEALAKLITGDNNAKFHEITVDETCAIEESVYMDYPCPHYYDDVRYENVKHTYHALYFSKSQFDTSLEEKYCCHNARIINKFTDRLNKIYTMYKEGNLDDEDYNVLLAKYLIDVKKGDDDYLPFS